MRIGISALFVVLFFGAGETVSALSLESAYEQVKARYYTVQNARLDISIANYQKEIAKSSLWPQITASGNLYELRNFNSDFNSSTRSAGLLLTQSIYKGGALQEAIKQLEQVVELRRASESVALLSLYESVANLYFQTLTASSLIDNYEEQLRALKKRITIISNRTKIGKSKTTDLIAARVQEARVAAQITAAKGSLDAYKMQLATFLGTSIRSQNLFYQNRKYQIPHTWLSKLDSHPLVISKRQQIKIQSQEQALLASSYKPSLDLNLGYTPFHNEENYRQSWSAQLQATWEIYSGGETKALSMVSKLEESKLTNELKYVELTLKNQFISRRDQLRLGQKEQGKLKEAVALAKRSYEIHQREYDTGLVSVLDVLRSLEDYLILKQALSAKTYENGLLFHQLKSLVGDIP